MTAEPSALDWLPGDLAPVALRLARADELQYELAQLCLEWSRNAVEFEQVRNPRGLLDAVVSSVRPPPPAIMMLISEAVNHLRAAIDNVVFYLVEQARGGALPPEHAHHVAMPIQQSADGLANWVNRRVKHVPELGTGTMLHTRIESLQPYRSLAVVTAVSAQLAALMGATELHGVHPLLLLQGYSNADKHRTIRPVVCRSVVTRSDQSFFGQNREMRPIAVGDVLAADVPQGQRVMLEAQTAIHIQRPDSQVWVGPGAELSQIHGFVADVLIPSLVTGGPVTSPLPRRVDLGDSAATVEERIRAGGAESAQDRAGREAWEMVQNDTTPPQVLAMPD
ncbi:hypothetical protein [Mycolicibacterium septicum]|uniref:hypothetical protein n=1 Tax=Mycolicibacterium septicum TaxID=98668 RepID=UPI001AF030C8|nr:hypothetical protein [Mycolicibacterium septicum]QRY50495.1 hypothetical protein JVX95_23885 [Mycolicibacterium septicum]